MELSVRSETLDGKTRRLTALTGGVEIFHEFDCVVPFGDDTLLDGHVLAVLLYAMSRGEDISVDGPLSLEFLRNADELQVAWSRWRPGLYKKIDIIPARIVSGHAAPKEKAIAAFSGGVDATFTALRHARAKKATAYSLSDVLLVHGFDVDLQNNSSFEKLKTRTEPLLRELGLNVLTVRTNSKSLGLQDWEDAFALQLAACLHMLSGEFGHGLIGSSEPYEALVLPCGSNPVTDHLMSGAAFRIVHDGAGFSRTDKVAEIAKHPTACKTLKVCWAGEDQGVNCGRCEKCVRTMLNFVISGNEIPPCFPNGLDIGDIGRMKIYNPPQMAEMRSVLNYAMARGLQGSAWYGPVKARVRRGFSSHTPPLLRRTILSALSAMGLKEPVKGLYRRVKSWHSGRQFPEPDFLNDLSLEKETALMNK